MTSIERLNTVISDMQTFKQSEHGRAADKVAGERHVEYVLVRLLMHVAEQSGFPVSTVTPDLLKPKVRDDGGSLE